MSPVDWVFAAVMMLCYVMVLSAMLSGAIKRYPLVFAYVALHLLISVAGVSYAHYFGIASREYVRAYWTMDFVSTFLVLMIIIHLVRRAMEGHPSRNTVYWGLMLGVLFTAGVTLLLMRYQSHVFSIGKWMTEVGRDYYFAAVILNAILWMVLMRSQHDSRQVFLIVSGLGLQLTGSAIGHALRLTSLVPVAKYVLHLTYIANLYIWYFAFKRLPSTVPVGSQKAEEVPAPETEVPSVRR